MITIHCRALARYSGRIDAELGLGDLVILIKDQESGGDGSVLVHGPSLVTPRNWMPAGTSFEEEPGLLRFAHPGRGELLEIFVETEYHRHRQQDELAGALVKLGAEREFSDLLGQQPGVLEEGLQLIEREYRTPAGPVDLLCVDRDGRPVAVEVKRRLIDTSALWQLKRYLAHLPSQQGLGHKEPRGLLAGPSIRRACTEALKSEPEILFVRVGYDDLVS